MSNEKKVELGDRVEDKISRLNGITVGVTDWLFGCRRFSVQPENAKDNKPVESFTIDDPQLTLKKKGVIKRPDLMLPDSGIKLGDRAKDKITGLTGIVVGVSDWIFSCRRFVLQPENSKDGKPLDSFVVDEPQLTLVEAEVIQPPKAREPEVVKSPSHGPRNDPGRRADPTR